MSGKTVRHPVEMITIGLESDRPARSPANDDVAYALVSRFNVRMHVGKHPRWSHLEGRNLAESADYETFWLRRLELFERVCIPSVLHLTPRPDAWFIAFGDVESWFVRELLERLRPYPWIRPYFREKGQPDDAGPLRDLLGGFVQSLGKPFLCSTRFDSDDSLHQQFIGALDRAISQLRERGFGDERRCLNVLYGLVESGGELSVFLRRNNMFQSVFEPAGDVAGPYAGGHDEVRERMPLVEIVTNLPMWIYHRHEETLEPSWVTGRDRLPLADPGMHYPSFGLKPTNGGDPRALRESVYWNATQVSQAVERARSRNLPALGRWLDPRETEASNPVEVLHELESEDDQFLNGAQLAWLARELDACGETALALRAFDYSVFAIPSDRHVRNERDALADALSGALDFDEQMEILAAAKPSGAHSNAVVFVVAGPSVEADPSLFERLRDRAKYLAQSGFAVTIMLAPGSDQHTPIPCLPDEVAVEHLDAGNAAPVGSDAMHRAMLRQLVKRIAEIGPSLLVADGSPVAQRLAAAVGRGLGIPVEFELPLATRPVGESRCHDNVGRIG